MSSAVNEEKPKRKRKTKAEKEAEERAMLEKADEKVTDEAGGKPLLEQTTVRAQELMEEAKQYFLGYGIVKLHGKGAVPLEGGRYVNRDVDEKHITRLVDSMYKEGIKDAR